MAPITEEELTKAIRRSLVQPGKIPPERAEPMARMVMGYFGLEDTVLDNKLASEDRDDFYRLEEEGLLASEEEDATVSRGKTWRIHYWLLKTKRIRDATKAGKALPPEREGAIYDEMGDEGWSRRPEGGGNARPPA